MNDFNNLNWLDWQIVVWVPLAIVTANEVRKNWRQIFDQDLSMADRAALQKINIFFLIPLIVLLHEIGHSLAILWAGGKIGEFHFGVWWGYVVPIGRFDDAQTLIIYLAGSAVQILVGFLCLLAAVFLRSPPIVALLIYCGLYSIAGTIIIYTLLSFAGMYGDWVAIYSSPLKDWVKVIGSVHLVMVAGLLYLLYGTYPKLWFSGKTRPKWYKDYLRARDNVEKEPTAVNYLSLAWTYYLVGLEKLTHKTLDIVEEKDPELLERYILSGCLKQGRGDIDGAVRDFEQMSESPSATPLQRLRALMSVGHALADKVEREVKPGEALTANDYSHVIEAYEQAQAADGSFADPRFYKATVLNKAGLHKEAEKELKDLQGSKWLDPALSELFGQEMQVARKSDNREQ